MSTYQTKALQRTTVALTRLGNESASQAVSYYKFQKREGELIRSLTQGDCASMTGSLQPFMSSLN